MQGGRSDGYTLFGKAEFATRLDVANSDITALDAE